MNEEISQRKSQIRQIIVTEGHCAEALDLYGIEPAIQQLVTKEKHQKKSRDLLSEINKISTIIEKNGELLSKEDLELAPPKKLKKELESLSENKVEGFFLIDNVVDYNGGKIDLGPHVVLLRETHHISPELARKLKSGIDHASLSLVKGADRSLHFVNDGFSYILCNIKSPYIELLMQRFSNLFSRIGVDDPEKQMIEKFLDNYILEASI